ncbi:MAG: hypothetical protein VW879_14905 [Opitutae bacterium]
MNLLGYSLVVGIIVVFFGLLFLWLVAENCWTKRSRITLGLLTLIISILITLVVTVTVTRLDDQSYYAAAVQTLLDETIVAIESGDSDYLQRLNTFRDVQDLTYESRSDLLENIRAFRDEGKILRSKLGTKQNASTHNKNAFANIHAIIESGIHTQSMPAGMVVRLYTDATVTNGHENAKERWEFSPGKVHRLAINESKESALYRREETLAFDTDDICRQLIESKLFSIAAGEGTGKPARMFSGTSLEGSLGERGIEILMNGESALEVGESCLFSGLSEIDAHAFNFLYEQLANQARNAFETSQSRHKR